MSVGLFLYKSKKCWATGVKWLWLQKMNKSEKILITGVKKHMVLSCALLKTPQPEKIDISCIDGLRPIRYSLYLHCWSRTWAFGWFYILTVGQLRLSSPNNHCPKGGGGVMQGTGHKWFEEQDPPLERVMVVFSLVYQGEMIERGGKNLKDPIIARHGHIFELLSAFRHLLGCLLSNCLFYQGNRVIWRVWPSNFKMWT